jgi:heterodisulfide reductase subunit B2
VPVLTYYPGCSLKTSSRFYERSLMEVLSAYDLSVEELEDWSCCGATAVRTIDEGLSDLLAARNLSLAEQRGYPIFAPCSACYNRLKSVNDRMGKYRDFRERLNSVLTPLQCRGTVEVRNVIEVFRDHVGIERIASNRPFDCADIQVVPYYGCVLTRLPGQKAFDDSEDPSSMDRLLWALGFQVMDWDFKMECCGASKTITARETTIAMSQAIAERAAGCFADAIVTSCPLCQMNLDLLPAMGAGRSILPVLFLTEAFELVLFGRLSGKRSHMVPTDGLLKKIRRY